VNAPLPFIPRGLNREQAAIYVGVGVTKFDEMVADGRMPQPKEIDRRRVWDRNELDAHFDNLGHSGGQSPEANPFDGVVV
jgi:predicted DNA-binding transcriptional regulator AlpA